MTQALDQAFRAAKEWLRGLDHQFVAAKAEPGDLRRSFGGQLPLAGMDPHEVVQFLTRNAPEGLLASAGPRFFAWVIGGALESALAADWLVATWDQNAALFPCGPSVSVIEETAGQWLLELFDLPRTASFAFTTGCQLAHVTALAAARHRLLENRGWDVEERGLFGAPPLTVLVNAERHGSVIRAVRFLGMGSNAVVPVPCNDQGQIMPSALDQIMANKEGPMILVLNAADLNAGVCDPFTKVIPMAQRAGAWVHVDGAFGLFARASRTKRHLLDGVEMADSWATDGHKWLNVPFDCGVAIVRDVAAHRAAMELSAPYISAQEGFRDQMDWNPEWSRRARGVPVYAALMELGREGVENLVDRCCAYCLALVEGIGALPGVEILVKPTLNQGLLRFHQPSATAQEDDRFTDETIARINAAGVAFFSGTTWRGRKAMRVSVVNWRTSEADVRRTIASVAEVLGV